MSYDPYAESSDVPPEAGSAELPPGTPADARKRVQAPAIALIVVGALNLLLAAGPAFYGFGVSMVPPEQLEEQLEEAMRKQNPQALEEAKAQGWDISSIRNLIVYGAFSLAGVDLLGSFLVLLGGIRMLALKSYGLAILASILAIIPGVSCSAFCCFGEIIGIWALVILLDSSVRAAFR